MSFIADLHIHSRYSRATSREMDLEHLSSSAREKGITLLATGDFTHHLWLEELRTRLKDKGSGLFSYDDVNFILATEVSNIFSKGGRIRKVHNLILAPSFDTVVRTNEALSRFGKLSSDGRPMLALDCESLVRIVLDIDRDCLIVPGHIWTPWFSLFGANSGFDAIEECFGQYAKDIYALETGLSSDPGMNWRWSALDRYALISNSDAHSPAKIGREANIFETELSYQGIVDALKNKEKGRLLSTIEFFPEEGKYHYDGHRNCNICLSPAETREKNYICPVCGKPLTVGVMHRLEKLGDREEGFVPEGAIPFRRIIPLEEIIAEVRNKGVGTVGVKREYYQLIHRLGCELKILLESPPQELKEKASLKVAEAILRIREGEVKISPGYDGVFGKITIFSGERMAEKQLTFF